MFKRFMVLGLIPNHVSPKTINGNESRLPFSLKVDYRDTYSKQPQFCVLIHLSLVLGFLTFSCF